ncbi:MAG: polysaccharide biosynthesis/export family protein [Phycisphaerae bacterium]
MTSGHRILSALGLLAAVWSAGGCDSSNADLIQFLRNHEHLATATEYRVGIPDRISISAPRILEIDQVEQTVGVDGKVSLRLLGAVRVAGMTPREIAAKFQELLQPYYKDPKVHIEVTEYASKKYYVFGDVAREGPFAYTGKDSVIDALSLAGPMFTAWRSRIQVIRPNADPEKRLQIQVDLDKMIKAGDLRLNVLLEPGDLVYVPPTPLGWVGHRVRELLYPLAPALQAYVGPTFALEANDEYTGNNEDN